MNETPTVSIIIPVKPGGSVRALGGVRKADYPDGCIEAIVAEGRRPSRQRNLAAAAASGEILYFLDDDSMVFPGFLQRAICHFQDPGVAAVGGPSLTPDSDSALQHSFAMAFGSIFGGGGMRNRYRTSGKVRVSNDSELILCNLAFRRDAFLAQGGFDERLYPNEENELLDRIKRGGWRLIHDPELFIYRSQRPTLKAFCRQLFSYGRGRGEQTLISGVVRPVTFIPPIFLVYLLLLPLANKSVYYLPLLCYLILTVIFSIYEGIKSGKAFSAAGLPLVFSLFHLCYGAGMLRGLSGRGWRHDAGEVDEISLCRLKDFDGEWT